MNKYWLSVFVLISMFLKFAVTYADNNGDSNSIVFIANKSVTVNKLKKREVQRIFLGVDMEWEDNSTIHFAILSDKVHEKFLKLYLKRTPFQYRLYWKTKFFSGGGIMPKSFESQESLIEYVSKTKGAIGYIKDSANLVNVKKIMVY